jgi:hypothetical protein
MSSFDEDVKASSAKTTSALSVQVDDGADAQTQVYCGDLGWLFLEAAEYWNGCWSGTICSLGWLTYMQLRRGKYIANYARLEL